MVVQQLSEMTGHMVDDEILQGNIDGVNVAFTLANTPRLNSVKLHLNGVRQYLGTHFTISGNTITMLSAPSGANGPVPADVLLADYRY
jgi:hypothetical protein